MPFSLTAQPSGGSMWAEVLALPSLAIAHPCGSLRVAEEMNAWVQEATLLGLENEKNQVGF